MLIKLRSLLWRRKGNIWQGAGDHWLHERRRRESQNFAAVLAISLKSRMRSVGRESAITAGAAIREEERKRQ